LGEPSLTFDPVSTDFGSIDVDDSCAYESYKIINKDSAGVEKAKNMSIYLVGSIGETEFIDSSWLRYSTGTEETLVGGSAGGNKCQVPSIISSASVLVKHRVIIPASPAGSGERVFFGRHKYLFT